MSDSFKGVDHTDPVQFVIPLVHDFRDERVLVFGGGSVGARKSRLFAREATVTVVSPTFADESFGDAELIEGEATVDSVSEFVDEVDPALVVAATDDATLNEAIERECERRNLLCNRADAAGERSPYSVVVPATVRDDPVVVSVSTGGRSPALSRHLRRSIEPAIDQAGAMATLTADLRADLKASDLPERHRSDAIRAVLDSERVWKALDTEGAKARSNAVDVIDEEIGMLQAGDSL